MKKLVILVLSTFGGFSFVACTVLVFLGIIYADIVSRTYLLLIPAGAAVAAAGYFVLKLVDRLIDG